MDRKYPRPRAAAAAAAAAFRLLITVVPDVNNHMAAPRGTSRYSLSESRLHVSRLVELVCIMMSHDCSIPMLSV